MATLSKVSEEGTKEEKAEGRRTKSTVREYFESICVAVILALFIRTFVVQAFKIPTGSMEQNLLIGDHLLVNKMVYSRTTNGLERTLMPTRDIRRGDVVVFKYPAEPDRDFIKRVIGLPGDRIRIDRKQVYINGEPLKEPYTFYLDASPENGGEGYYDFRRDDLAELVIPEGRYFVMGDNRDNSHDSRFWGLLSRDLIKGRALLVYWSYEAPREEYLEESPVERVKQIASVVWNFGRKTRWKRFFHIIH